jgi:uncharacterized repeat protein (TIGR03847 family)
MSFDFRDPDSFTAGTVGPPGQRVFYIQAVDGNAVVSWQLEKQQVNALAEYLRGILQDLPGDHGTAMPTAFVEPVVPVWNVGNIGVGYDNETDRVILVAEELQFEDDSDAAPADQARVMLSRAQCQAFIERTHDLMSGGRPPCRLCGGPIDPVGHVCPRDN